MAERLNRKKKNMKASLVLKLLLLAYLPLSVYYSLQSSFEESTAVADVSVYWYILVTDTGWSQQGNMH